MNDNDPNLDEHEPSWMQDGIEITSEQRDFQDEDNQDWDTNAWTRDTPDFGEVRAAAAGCLSSAGEPPDSGTYVLGSIDGECQWISTTEC